MPALLRQAGTLPDVVNVTIACGCCPLDVGNNGANPRVECAGIVVSRLSLSPDDLDCVVELSSFREDETC